MIHRSPWPAPAESKNDLSFSEGAAVIDGASGRALSHASLAQGAARVAGSLVKRGVAPGDVVAVWLPNGIEHALAVRGAWQAGAAVQPLNPYLRPEEAARLMADAGATCLVAAPGTLDAVPLEALLDGEPVPAAGLDPEAVALLPYSSGTTGPPKGVMLSHRALAANARQMAQWPVPQDPRTVAVSAVPMFHAFGVVLYHGVLLARGATIVVSPRFTPEGFMEAIARYRATYAAIVQPLARALAAGDGLMRRVGSLARVTCGSTALGEPLARAIEQGLGAPVFESYGMTELCGASHAQRPGDPRASVGPALADNEWMIADLDTGRPLPPGVDGEIRVRGPSLMSGYLGRPSDTASTLEGGWLHTGDLGRADREGRLYVTGRLKELIKVEGYQVAPAEIEALLCSHPAVEEACVSGEPDSAGREAPVAYVVRRGEVSAEALQSWVAARVAPFKRLREVVFVPALPRSAAGKVLRRELAALKRD